MYVEGDDYWLGSTKYRWKKWRIRKGPLRKKKKVKQKTYREIKETGVSTRTGTTVFVSEQLNEVSVGDRVVSRNLVQYLRSRNIQFSSKNSRNKKGLDITENWQPSEEYFILAKEDMEKHNLKFSFSSVEDLYIKDGVSKYWFERYL